MAVTFKNIPNASQFRVPGVYAEFDPSQAGAGTVQLNTLIIAQMTPGGLATPGFAEITDSLANAAIRFGNGSMAYRMLYRVRQKNPLGTVWVLPLADDPAAVAATGTLVIGGPSTAPGTIAVYIAGQRVLQAVAPSTASTAIATALAATINATPTLPVIATVAGSTVTLTAKNKGACGNDILILPNFGGVAAGEYTPAGLTYTVTPMSGGLTNPSLTTPLLNLGDLPFEFYAVPYLDTTSLLSIETFLADDVGRWSYLQMLYGHAFIAFRGTLGATTTFTAGRNSQHVTCMPFSGAPDPYWEWAADICGMAASSVIVDPNQPFNTLPLSVRAPTPDQRYSISQRNTLLFSGASTFKVAQGGVVEIDRLITMSQFDATGAPISAYLNAERMFQLASVARAIANFQAVTFPRAVIVADDSPVPVNSSYVNTKTVKAAVIGYYQQLEAEGSVTDSVSFAKAMAVENVGNGRFNELLPITLPNQLEQIAMKIQFKAA